MPIELYIFSAIILFLAAYTKGVTGFGSSLIAIPLLAAFVLVPEDARALVVTINLILNIFILASAKKLSFKALKPFSILIITVFIASILSGFLLPSFDARLFNIVMGILLIVTALNNLLNIKFRIEHPSRYFIPIGILGGTLNTLIGAGSVPVLIFLANTNLKKADFRIAILFFLLILNSGSLISFVINANYSYAIAYQALLFMPVVLLGSFLGIRSQNKFNENTFKRIIAVLLLVMGINAIFNIF